MLMGRSRNLSDRSGIITSCIKTYRCALYVDYPSVTPSKVRAEDYSKQAFPMIHVLPAKSVINWDTIIIGNQQNSHLL